MSGRDDVTALVTGATGTVGQAIALHLARDGHDVALHYRSAHEVAQALVTQVAEVARPPSAHPPASPTSDARARRAVAIPVDLSDDVDARAAALVELATAALGPLDVAVLNAADQTVTTWDDLDAAAWDSMYAGTLRSTAVVLRAVAEHMSATLADEASGEADSAPRSSRAHGRNRVIVVIGSIEGLRAARHHTAYAVMKAAVHHLVSAAAHELGPTGIRVVGVAPGLIDRAGLEQDWPEGVARWRASAALGRAVTADEVAQAVSFLASPSASAVTGVTVPVDAGWSAHPGW